MTDDEALQFYNDLEEFFGDLLVNYEHHPIQFATQVKLYKFYKERENESSSVQ